MSTDNDALRELLADVDHGWRVAEQTHGEWYGIQSNYFALGNMSNESDARIAVAAVNALPDLLDERDRMLATIARVEALAAEWEVDQGRTWIGSLGEDLRVALAGEDA